MTVLTPINFNKDHITCGSRIYNYDYDGYLSVVDVAARIISDYKFDEKCRKGAANGKNRV